MQSCFLAAATPDPASLNETHATLHLIPSVGTGPNRLLNQTPFRTDLVALAEFAEHPWMKTWASNKSAMPAKQSAEKRVIVRSGYLTLLAAILLANIGCINPMTTRLPSFYTANPQIEGFEFQRQDPFPDPDIAPDGGSRPPDFQRPRTPSRKAAEQRLFQGMKQLPQTIPRGAPLSGKRHPASVL